MPQIWGCERRFCAYGGRCGFPHHRARADIARPGAAGLEPGWRGEQVRHGDKLVARSAARHSLHQPQFSIGDESFDVLPATAEHARRRRHGHDAAGVFGVDGRPPRQGAEPISQSMGDEVRHQRRVSTNGRPGQQVGYRSAPRWSWPRPFAGSQTAGAQASDGVTARRRPSAARRAGPAQLPRGQRRR